jgi:predicted SAM-dependent methyltransferase
VRRHLRALGLHLFARQLKVLAWEVRMWCRDLVSRVRARRYRGRTDLKLNLGCGPKVKAGWIDADANPDADLHLDLRRTLPFADGSCAVVYSEHFFEHLDYPDTAMEFLRECRRVLGPHGVLSLGVPDVVPALRACLKDIDGGVTDVEPQPYHPAWCRTPMDQTNFLFRQNYVHWLHEHRYAYDFDTLAKRLAEAGFVAIRRRDYDPALDSADRALGTVYVEARAH